MVGRRSRRLTARTCITTTKDFLLPCPSMGCAIMPARACIYARIKVEGHGTMRHRHLRAGISIRLANGGSWAAGPPEIARVPPPENGRRKQADTAKRR